MVILVIQCLSFFLLSNIFLLRFNLNTGKFTKVYNSVCFDKVIHFVIHTLPWYGTFPSRKNIPIPHTLPWQLTTSPPRRSRHSDFCHCTLELHLREITQQCVWNFPQRNFLSCLKFTSRYTYLGTVYKGSYLNPQSNSGFLHQQWDLDISQSHTSPAAAPAPALMFHSSFNATVDGYLGSFNFPSCKQLPANIPGKTSLCPCVQVSLEWIPARIAWSVNKHSVVN